MSLHNKPYDDVINTNTIDLLSSPTLTVYHVVK